MDTRSYSESELPLTGEYILPGLVPPRLYQEHIHRYELAGKLSVGKDVVDVACGTGYGSAYLADIGARRVFAGDISQAALESAKRRYWRAELKYFQLDGMRLPLADSCIDLACSFETLEHVDRPKDLVLECWRILKPGGMFLCSTPNRALTSPVPLRPVNPYHRHELSLEEFTQMLSEYFTEVKLLGQDFYETERALLLRLRSMFLQILGLHAIGRMAITKAIQRRMNPGLSASMSQGIPPSDGRPTAGERWELRRLNPNSNCGTRIDNPFVGRDF